MASAARKRAPEPEPVRPIIVKKIVVEGHGGHHGGAWKVAYADFVTAMMAFFLLLWILGATTEKQRKGIADYFSPTLVETRQKSGGGNGPLGGDSLTAKDKYPKSGGNGSKSITIPRDATGGKGEGALEARKKDRARFASLTRQILQKMAQDRRLNRLRKSVRFVETREGLRIDLVDQADFAMFALGTDALLPDAMALVSTVAGVISAAPNDVIVRGHTDALPYAAGRSVNNWTLSAARAEATRKALAVAGVGPARFARIEGVADREPNVPADRYDPRNRRMSVTLAWGRAGEAAEGGGEARASQTADAAPAH